MNIMPPFPLVAEPLERLMDPESPTLDVPVENNTSPLTPAVPAFTVYRNMEPLVVASDMPPYTKTDPPVAEDDPIASPPTRLTSEPTPLRESPTSILITPAVPPVESPVDSIISPVSPPFELPVSSSTNPLVPPPAAFAVRRVDVPLLVAAPYPLEIRITPPEAPLDCPACTAIPPPSWVAISSLVPTYIETDPAEPAEVAPVNKLRLPDPPDTAAPVDTNKAPLTPAAAEFIVASSMSPLVVAALKPERKLTLPPVPYVE